MFQQRVIGSLNTDCYRRKRLKFQHVGQRIFNPLNRNINVHFILKTQFVPRSKHVQSWL